MTSNLSKTELPPQYQSWLRNEAQRQNIYPDVRKTSLSPAHVQKLWQCIDGGADEDVGLSKLLVGLKQTNPAERAALMMSPRTQWSSTPSATQMTPLMAAVATGVVGTVRTLLDQGGTGVQLGVKVGTQTCNAMTVAAERGLVDIMSLLVEFGRLGSADALRVVDAQTPNPATVAWLRAQGVEPEQFGGAFENACSPARRDIDGMATLLRIGGVDFAKHSDLLPRVVLDGDYKFAKALVDLGAPLDVAALSLPVAGKTAGKKNAPVLAVYAPLELVIFDKEKKNAEAQVALGIHRPTSDSWAPGAGDGDSDGDDAANDDVPASVARRGLISALVSKGAPVTTDALKALVQQGDYAIYADIVTHRDFWPRTVGDVEVMRSLVDLNAHPFVHQMLTHQIEVMQENLKQVKGKNKAGVAGVNDDVAARRREIASENFDDAANIVMGGTSQIKLGNTSLAAASNASVEGRALSNALVVFAKKAVGNKDAGPSNQPAAGRKLASDEKPVKSPGLFGRFKKNG